MKGELEAYQKYIEKVDRQLNGSQRKNPHVLKGLADFSENYATLARMFLSEKISRAHVIGLKSALHGLFTEKTPLFTESFGKIIHLLSKVLSEKVLKKNFSQSEEILEGWIQLVLLVSIGIIDTARENQRISKKEKSVDTPFRDELLLLLFFHSEYPRHLFKEMGEALEIESSDLPFFISSFETLAILASLCTLSKTPGEWGDLPIERIAPRLLQNIDLISRSLDKEGQDKIFWGATLEKMRLALEQKELEELVPIWVEFLEELGYSKEHFSSDLAEIKKLFSRFKIAYRESQENKSTLVNLVG